MLKETIINRIRARTGVTESQITDDDLGTIISSALDEYVLYKPNVNLTTSTQCIVTVKDQPDYAFPADALWIINVFWAPMDNFSRDLYKELISEQFDEDHLVDLLIQYNKLAKIRQYFSGTWKVINNKIWLIPSPNTDGEKVAVLYATQKTLVDLSSITDHLFEDLVVGMTFERRGFDLIQSSGWRAGAYSVSSQTGQAFIKKAEDMLKDVRVRLAMNYVGVRDFPHESRF
ncbi:MAG: hypothetical protein WCQ65_09345 [Fermentimonas sp.]